MFSGLHKGMFVLKQDGFRGNQFSFDNKSSSLLTRYVSLMLPRMKFIAGDKTKGVHCSGPQLQHVCSLHKMLRKHSSALQCLIGDLITWAKDCVLCSTRLKDTLYL